MSAMGPKWVIRVTLAGRAALPVYPDQRTIVRPPRYLVPKTEAIPFERHVCLPPTRTAKAPGTMQVPPIVR
jgi:hypothetical protein